MPKGKQPKENKIMSTIAYKGFERDMTCRDFQYEEGKTYYEPNAKLCECGFHACMNPIDIFPHYAPGNSLFHKVILDGVAADKKDNTKICGNKIAILEEISIQGIASLCVQHTLQRCKETKSSGNSGLSVAESEASAISGDWGKSIVEDRSVAKTGYKGFAIARNRSIARVDSSGIAAAGYYSVALAGDNGSASTLDFGIAISEYAGHSLSGYRGAAIAGGQGIAVAGPDGYAQAGRSGLACSGMFGIANTSDNGISVSKGSSTTGKDGLAVAKGQNVKVKGDIGALLVIAEIDNCNNIKHFATAIVGKNNIEPNTWYKLNYQGKFIPV